jgi:ubiquinone/menaquinone biosynthesis C-methylase UbiE
MASREQTIVRHLVPFFKPQQRVLEIGAGNGLVAEQLHQATGAAFTLVDVVDYNRSRLPLHVFDGRALPFSESEFDLTLLVFVLHHNPDPRPLLREALRVSRSGLLVVENDVRGSFKKPFTRIIDSTEHVRRGVPQCYFTKTADEWLVLMERLPARAQLLSRFNMGWFWKNIVLQVNT